MTQEKHICQRSVLIWIMYTPEEVKHFQDDIAAGFDVAVVR